MARNGTQTIDQAEIRNILITQQDSRFINTDSKSVHQLKDQPIISTFPTIYNKKHDRPDQ